MKSNSFRWGILGPGRIAHKFASSLPCSKNGILTAVASKDYQRAQNFAKEYNADHCFSSYLDLIQSDTVDAIYIATPHSFHFENAALCLKNGKPVLCEKPLTLSVDESQRLVDLSVNHNTFLMEGMWTVFLPHFVQCQKWIAEGRIGEIVHVQADFGYLAENNPENRLYNPSLGGSVTKDIGIYPLTLFYKLLGLPHTLNTLGTRALTGVDNHVVFQGINSSKSTFQGMVSFLAQSEVAASIVGTKGRIHIHSQWLRPAKATLQTADSTEVFEEKVPGFGFQFEANEVESCVNSGKIESSVWSHQDSINIAKLISMVEMV